MDWLASIAANACSSFLFCPTAGVKAQNQPITGQRAGLVKHQRVDTGQSLQPLQIAHQHTASAKVPAAVSMATGVASDKAQGQ